MVGQLFFGAEAPLAASRGGALIETFIEKSSRRRTSRVLG
jgi:hypothetical protein